MQSILSLWHNPTVRWLLRLIIAVSLLALLAVGVDWQATWQLLQHTNLWLFLVGFLLLCSRNVIGAWRWRVLLQSRGYMPAFGALVHHYFVGTFFNLVLPTAVGGDVVRGYALHRCGTPPAVAASSILIERTLGVAALLATALGALLAGGHLFLDASVYLLVLGLSMACAGLMAGMFWQTRITRPLPAWFPGSLRPLLENVGQLIADIRTYGRDLHVLGGSLLISLLLQLVSIFWYYVLALAVGATTPLLYYLIFIPLVAIASMLPVSISGIGVREGTFVVLLGLVGMPAVTAVAISALIFLQTILQGLVGGVLLILQRGEHRRFAQPSQH
jgi:hypothetical protein